MVIRHQLHQTKFDIFQRKSEWKEEKELNYFHEQAAKVRIW
jgi:hypothetical protein